MGKVKANTIRQLAKACGRSHTSVRKWIADDRWPFSKSGPWDPAKVKAWAAEAHADKAPDPGEDPDASYLPATPERQAKLALALEKLETAKLMNQFRRGELHSTADCRERRVRQVQELKHHLLGMADELAPRLELTDQQRAGINEHIIKLLRYFAGQDPIPPKPDKDA